MPRPTRTHDVFTAVAEPTRRSILGVLDASPHTVSAIVGHLDFSQPTISEHLRILNHVGLVDSTQQGRERRYALIPEGLTPVAQWLVSHQYWTQRLDALGVLLEGK
jgi:DNA-binding transcriptional ArsR family regulator